MRISSVALALALSAPLALAGCGYGGERGNMPADREGANYLPADPLPPPKPREKPIDRQIDFPGGTGGAGFTR